jgi:hypothetical protein
MEELQGWYTEVDFGVTLHLYFGFGAFGFSFLGSIGNGKIPFTRSQAKIIESLRMMIIKKDLHRALPGSPIRGLPTRGAHFSLKKKEKENIPFWCSHFRRSTCIDGCQVLSNDGNNGCIPFDIDPVLALSEAFLFSSFILSL